MSKMTLSTLINECKKICLDKCIQAIKTINQKNTYTTGFEYNATKNTGKSLFKQLKWKVTEVNSKISFNNNKNVKTFQKLLFIIGQTWKK